jgi:hypothetical protein
MKVFLRLRGLNFIIFRVKISIGGISGEIIWLFLSKIMILWDLIR